MTSTHEAIAARLREAADSGVPCPPVRHLADTADMESGYAVQRINTELSLARGRRIVGYKVGLTSRSVQVQLGVDQPDFGILFADMAVDHGAEIETGRLLQPRAEAEIAFVLGRDIAAGPIIVSELISAIEYALPAVEIVDSRIAGWDIGIFDTVADNASSALFVLGCSPRRLTGIDLRLAGMRLDYRGDTVSTGNGAACLGNPLNAALWLVNRLLANSQTLRAGDVILSGALGPMVPVAPGGYEARISGMDAVRVHFRAGSA